MLDLKESTETGWADHNAEKHEPNTLQPTESLPEAQIAETEENRNGQFHRSFSPRQVHVRLHEAYATSREKLTIS
jgi:amino acid transporter